MKKILVLSDIHANYPALMAIQNHVQRETFHRIVNTGDFTVYGTYPNEVVQWFRERGNAICIVGNTDKRVLEILTGKELEKPKREEKRIMYFWTCENLLPENVRYLNSLPEQQGFTAGGLRIGLFHGDFDGLGNPLWPDSPESLFREWAAKFSYQVHVMGHIHVPFHRIVDGVHFLNPGSAGRPFDGDPRSSFAILTVSSGKITVEHFRIPYSVEEVTSGLKKNGLPDIYGEMYRTGRKLN
ncbi:MAG: metallophosphoesterase family protein [Deltaproteobacteria bacterium]|nr:MAG: metallophosphoesterase family protein [Deltaproteobacteria bacterium]